MFSSRACNNAKQVNSWILWNLISCEFKLHGTAVVTMMPGMLAASFCWTHMIQVQMMMYCRFAFM